MTVWTRRMQFRQPYQKQFAWIGKTFCSSPAKRSDLKKNICRIFFSQKLPVY